MMPTGLRVFGFVCVSLAGFAVASSWADEPAKIDGKAQQRIVVKPGTTVSKVPRPITPTSFDVEVGTVAAGSEVLVEMEIKNTSTSAIQILGGNAGCAPAGCIHPVGKYPRIIPPGGTGKIESVYMVSKRGGAQASRHAELDAFFYVGATTTFAVPYRISGEILPEAAGTVLGIR